jgi:hypothetical protein
MFDWREQLPQLTLFPPAAVLALGALLDRRQTHLPSVAVAANPQPAEADSQV